MTDPSTIKSKNKITDRVVTSTEAILAALWKGSVGAQPPSKRIIPTDERALAYLNHHLHLREILLVVNEVEQRGMATTHY